MKVFTIEFTMFNGVVWEQTEYKITETSKKKLEVAVKSTLNMMSEYKEPRKISSGRKTIDEKWEEIKENVVETELKFPIIEKLT